MTTVHDTLQLGDRIWTVSGVFLGGLNQESVLGLQVSGEHHDADAYGKLLPELFVPEIMVRQLLAAGLMTRHVAPTEGPSP